MQNPTRLFNRNFFLLWQGQFISNLGNQVYIIALIFWIKEAYDSASIMGFLLLVAGIPPVIFGPIGGALADRYSRRNIIVLSDLISGLAMFTLTGAMYLFPEARHVILGMVFLVTIIVATAGAFFQPAIDAAIPDLVPETRVTSANSLNEFSVIFSTFLGQGLGGVLFRLLGAPVLLLINACTFLFSAISEAFITVPQHLPERPARWQDHVREFKSDILSGLQYIWRIPGLRLFILLLTFVNFMGTPIIVLLPFYVEDVLRLTPDWYGYLIAAFSLGMLLGYLLAGTVQLSSSSRSHMILASMVLEGVAYLIIVLVGTPLAALVLSPLAGLLNGLLTVHTTTVLQIATPADMRGRVFGLMGTILSSIAPLSAGLAGVAADLLGQNIPLVYLICSISIIVLTSAIALSRTIRDFLAQNQPSEISGGPQLPSDALSEGITRNA